MMENFSIRPEFQKVKFFGWESPLQLRKSFFFLSEYSSYQFDFKNLTLIEYRKKNKSHLASLVTSKARYRGQRFFLKEIRFGDYSISVDIKQKHIIIHLLDNCHQVFKIDLNSFYFKKEVIFNHDSISMKMKYGKTMGNPEMINVTCDLRELQLAKILSNVMCFLIFDNIADCGSHV